MVNLPRLGAAPLLPNRDNHGPNGTRTLQRDAPQPTGPLSLWVAR